MRVLSNEQWEVLRLLKQQPMTLAEVQAAVPADGRTVLVARASLSRSLRRLVMRGNVVAENHRYSVRTFTAEPPKPKPASVYELAMQQLERLKVRSATSVNP